jgi:hypothetical protein
MMSGMENFDNIVAADRSSLFDEGSLVSPLEASSVEPN